MSAKNVLPFPSKGETEEIKAVECGLRYAKVSHDITEALAKVSLKTTETRVLWAVIRKTYGFQKAWDRISSTQLAELTGMTPQKASSALCSLIKKNIIIRKGGAYGQIKINSNSSDWDIKKKGTKSNLNSNTVNDTKLGYVNSNAVRPINSNAVRPINSNAVRPINSNAVNTRDNIRDNIRDKDTVSFSDENNAPSQPLKKVNCPHKAIIDLYHEILPELPQVKIVSTKRKSSLRARWVQDKKFQTLDFWQRMFTYVRKNDFLMGRVQPTNGRRVFLADFDFLISPKGFVGLLEGKYEN